MIVILVALAPVLVGFVVIFMIARYSPNVPRTAPLVPGRALDDRPEITSDEFQDLIEELVASLGLETIFSSVGTGGVMEMTLRDPRPLTGGRILLTASPVLAGQLGSVDVLGFAEGVRADMGALKGILIALAGFTDEARVSVQTTPAPVDLIDGEALAELVGDHLDPERHELVTGYRGFGPA